MTVRSIAQRGNKVLSLLAAKVEFPDATLAQLVEDLRDTMIHASGAGIAAPQIGVSKQVCIVEVRKNPRYPYFPEIPRVVLVNPSWRATSDSRFEHYEGCLSVPQLRGKVMRNTDIVVNYWDVDGKSHSFETQGIAAAVFQHEIDHLLGELFIDKAFDVCSEKEFFENKVQEYQAYLQKVLS